jgi:hypothetical protein
MAVATEAESFGSEAPTNDAAKTTIRPARTPGVLTRKDII